MFRKLFLITAILCGLLSSSLVLASQLSPQSAATTAIAVPKLLSAQVSGQAVAAPGYIFWPNNIDGQITLFGYRLSQQLTFQLSVADTLNKTNLASDGQTVAWVETASDGSQSIEGYDLVHNLPLKLTGFAPNSEFSDLAIANRQLFYHDSTPGHSGLYQLIIGSNQPQLISLNGEQPVAAGNMLAWNEETYQGPDLPPVWTLHLRTPSNNDQVLATGEGQFQVSMTADQLVWSALPPATDQGLYSYAPVVGKPQLLSADPVRQPQVAGNQLTWITPPVDRSGETGEWSVQTSNISQIKAQTMIRPGSAALQLVGFAGPTAVAFLVSQDSASSVNSLYVVNSNTTNAQNFQAKTTITPSAVHPLTTAADVIACGQVYKQGTHLFDCNGTWPVNGVQFILPNYGINGQTFYDGNYNDSVASGQVDYWLNQAQYVLGAKMLRLFIDMPNDSGAGPTSPATLYDFATRAASRGMRVGLVLHNDTTWSMSASRKQWIASLISYFKTRNALPLIAYVSADNEINNHCANDPDCFDNNPSYVSKATQWVADFSSYVKSQAPTLLVTVGISTEKNSADGQTAVYDFFRRSGTAPAMATSVDFLAPHNYHGGGYGLWPTLRYNLGYTGPIVLEEYGYSTDLLSANPAYTEGPAVCRDNPYDTTCSNTAPYYIEVNARSMRENSVDGFAGGSAWMMADSSRKDCASPSDFYSGLVASGDYPRCTTNGTSTTTAGSLKSTGARIRYQNTGLMTPPINPPSSLKAPVVSSTSISLTWQNNTPGEIHIERKTGAAGQWAEITTVVTGTSTYLNNNLAAATTYVYRIRSFADNGVANFSAYSNEISATTMLAAPTGLTAAGVSMIEVNLNWSYPTSGVSLQLQRRQDSVGTWVVLALLPGGTISYRDIGLTAGTGYSYRLRALGSGNSASDYSTIADAATRSTADFTVNSSVETGSLSVGTLGFALSQAQAGQSIFLAPPGGVISVNAALPVVSTGVTIIGGCQAASGPTVRIQGGTGLTGLKLNGNTIIYGLNITGFSGPQLDTTKPGNLLQCTKTGQ